MQHPEASGQGISRNQSHLSSLEDKITSDNYARFIDAFIKFMDLDKRTIQKKEAFMPLEIFITLIRYSHS